MNTRETYLRDLVTQMLKVNFEITVLSFRVEEAMPDVRRDCYRHVRALQDSYKNVEDMVQAFIIEGQGESEEGRYDEIDCALQELLRLLDCEGTAIRGRLSDRVYFREELPGSLSESRKFKSRNRESHVQVMVRRKKRKRMMPLENWVESELWSRKKIT